MTYATEFFAVQKALGITVNSMGNSGFKKADEENSNRIEMAEKNDFLGIFVDGALVVSQFKGKDVSAQADQVRKHLGI